MKLFTIEDQNRLSEARYEAEQRVLKLAEILISGRVNESVGFDVGEQLLAEAHKLEKIIIVEALSDQDFNTLQKNFRSLLRPIGSLVKNLAGTDLASKLDAARITGTELLNDLYDDVKNVEAGVGGAGVPKSKEMSVGRDKLAKCFADIAILTKGAMALGDLFSDDPASLGGYTAMKEITSSLERDDLLSVPLRQAFVAYAESVKANSLDQHEKDDAKHDDWFAQGDANTHWDEDQKAPPPPRKDNVPGGGIAKKKKQGFFSRLFGKKHEGSERIREYQDEAPATKRGGFSTTNFRTSEKDPFPQQPPEKDPFGSNKHSHLEKKFKAILQKAMLEKSPGFARMVNVPALIDTLMNKSYDHLAAVFGRFNDLVSNDVDMNFLKSVVNKPLSVSGALKTVWDSFSSGTMGGTHGRPR